MMKTAIKLRYFSRNLMCPTSGIAYQNPEPNSFSFNSPKGMCNDCRGLGIQQIVNRDKIIPDSSISIKAGGIIPLGSEKSSWSFKQMEIIAQRYDFNLSDPINKIPAAALEIILKGGAETFTVESKTLGITRSYKIDYEGIENFIKNQFELASSTNIKRWASDFMDENNCLTCKGSRLSKEARFFKINKLNIAELAQMDLDELYAWFDNLPQFLCK